MQHMKGNKKNTVKVLDTWVDKKFGPHRLVKFKFCDAVMMQCPAKKEKTSNVVIDEKGTKWSDCDDVSVLATRTLGLKKELVLSTTLHQFEE
jgi:hypothetical protein